MPRKSTGFESPGSGTSLAKSRAPPCVKEERSLLGFIHLGVDVKRTRKASSRRDIGLDRGEIKGGLRVSVPDFHVHLFILLRRANTVLLDAALPERSQGGNRVRPCPNRDNYIRTCPESLDGTSHCGQLLEVRWNAIVPGSTRIGTSIREFGVPNLSTVRLDFRYDFGSCPRVPQARK